MDFVFGSHLKCRVINWQECWNFGHLEQWIWKSNVSGLAFPRFPSWFFQTGRHDFEWIKVWIASLKNICRKFKDLNAWRCLTGRCSFEMQVGISVISALRWTQVTESLNTRVPNQRHPGHLEKQISEELHGSGSLLPRHAGLTVAAVGLGLVLLIAVAITVPFLQRCPLKLSAQDR